MTISSFAQIIFHDYLVVLRSRVASLVVEKLTIYLVLITYCIIVTVLARLTTRPVTGVIPANSSNVDGLSSLILHYVWIENRRSAKPRDLTALQYLSVLSAINILRPHTIFLHSNGNFSGPLWLAVEKYVVIRPITVRPTVNGGQPLMHIEHEADMIKLQAAYEWGGIFVDFDVYFTGHREEYITLYEKYDCVFTEFHNHNRTFLAIGNFGCRRHSPFIKAILEEYQTNFRGYKCYDPSDPIPFLYNGCLYPYVLLQRNAKFRESVKIANNLLMMFPRKDVFLSQNGKVDWSGAFNVHSGYEGEDLSMSQIWRWNSTFGDVLRSVMNHQAGHIYTESAADCMRNSASGPILVITDTASVKRKGFITSGRFFSDLTTIQFLAVLSAIRHSSMNTIQVRTRGTMSGPFWSFLTMEARKANICLKNSVYLAEDSEERLPESSVALSLHTMTLKSLRGLRSCRMNSTKAYTHLYCEGHLQKSSVLTLNYSHFRIKLNSRVHYSNYTFVNFERVDRSLADVTLEVMREQRSISAAVLRLIYYGSTGVIRDRMILSYPCR